MFGIDILEVAIGLCFTYLVFSSVGSVVFNIVSKMMSFRSRDLEKGIRHLLEEPGGNLIVRELYKHHLIDNTFWSETSKGKEKMPTWVDGRSFAVALMDVLDDIHVKKLGADAVSKKSDEDVAHPTRSLTPSEKISRWKKNVSNVVESPTLAKKIMDLLHDAEEKVGAGENAAEKAREKISKWFDSHISITSTWFKQRARRFIFFFSIIPVLAFNVDTIRMTKIFWNDDELRTAVVDMAQKTMKTTTPVTADTVNLAGKTYDEKLLLLKKDLARLDGVIEEASVLPIGWTGQFFPDMDINFSAWAEFWLYKILGLLITLMAVSLGATYWHQLLKSLIAFRKKE